MPAWPAGVPVVPVASAPGQQPATGTPPGYAAPPPGQPVYPGQSVYQPVAAPGAPVYPGVVGQPAYPATGYATGGYIQPPGTYPPAGAVPGVPGVPPGQPGLAPGHTPDFGQGQIRTAGPSGMAAGRAVAQARFGNQARSIAGAATGNGAATTPAASPAQQ